ncbi:MAG: phosphotransferase [Ruminococcus sp.]|uniref:phosphotransferase family protein n=1 Tax=Ruminococcus sp. TaxID=41978 RepID=UPI002872DC04|nr:phosphotransferase [Ruminococcus sp.]MBQ3285594.1 phosphotransferase [Ruminococcus sp.]
MDNIKQHREITLEEKELLGVGTTAEVYRFGDDRILKIYHAGQDPAWIEAQWNNTQQLYRHGVPGPVPYEIVSVGDRLGVIYERLDDILLGEAISREPERLDEYAKKLALLLRQIHQTKFEKNLLIDTSEFLAGHFNVTAISRYTDKDAAGFASALNKGNTLIHGDFHPMNILVKDGRLIPIDTGDAYYRHGILDLVTLYTFLILQTDNPEKSMKMTSMMPDAAHNLWDAFVRYYFAPQTEEEKNGIEMIIKRVALIRTAMALAVTDDMEESFKTAMICRIMAATPSDLDAFREEINAFEEKYQC